MWEVSWQAVATERTGQPAPRGFMRGSRESGGAKQAAFVRCCAGGMPALRHFCKKEYYKIEIHANAVKGNIMRAALYQYTVPPCFNMGFCGACPKTRKECLYRNKLHIKEWAVKACGKLIKIFGIFYENRPILSGRFLWYNQMVEIYFYACGRRRPA